MEWAIARLKHSESDVERHRLRTVIQSTPSTEDTTTTTTPSSQQSLRQVQAALDTFADDIDTLLEFYDLNFTAISKILKKYDKRTCSNVRDVKLLCRVWRMIVRFLVGMSRGIIRLFWRVKLYGVRS